ncbi:hypothetical protein K461DRAFT_322822 [Myriangium duriaei CBS 260.36]|uniref:Uncharacterized protein n=1 Tax=Myriangium duriaei CBS 260.36 TaxID=1168546 RepID=A0A9P4J0V7_9PEZI|nr:hypothetical protein K461DRAFT_322822 [Myriangium duriaei CBS 260.36]
MSLLSYFLVTALTACLTAIAGPVPVRSNTGFTRLSQDDVALTWGPTLTTGRFSADITSFSTTTYPGAPPATQKGGLFMWPGLINNDAGDLIQSIVGQYPPGQSECQGTNEDHEWCISSEVYHPSSSGTVQLVGTKLTLDANPTQGVKFVYKLTDGSKGDWTQTATDARTGTQLATYSYKSGQKNEFQIAVECQDCTPTVNDSTYVDTVVTFASAVPDFASQLYSGGGATYSKPTTSDGGKTWTISKITMPKMS